MSIKLMTVVWDCGAYDGGSLITLLALADWARDDGSKIYPTVRQLVLKTRLDERQVRRILKSLQNDGVLLKVAEATGKPGIANEYRLDVARLWAAGTKGGHDVTPDISAVEGGHFEQDGGHFEPPYIDKPLSTTAIKPLSSAKAEKKTGFSQDFAEFYAVFPRKKGRLAAEKAYGRARKSAPAATLLGGACRYAKERAGEDPNFTLHPATWLNQGRWEDEAGPASPPSKNGRAGLPEAISTARWVKRLEIFHLGEPADNLVNATWPGTWDPKWGPRPGQPGCQAPAEALAEYGRLHPPRLAAG